MQIERIQQPDTSTNSYRGPQKVEAKSKDTLTNDAVTFNHKKKKERDAQHEEPNAKEHENENPGEEADSARRTRSSSESSINVVA